VRRLWESQGVTVSRLTRVRYGTTTLPRWLRPGRWEELSEAALHRLRQAVGLEKADSEPPKRGPKKPMPRKTRHGTSQSRRRRNPGRK
jgi:23S rRNA pseudouridine2605 synthase